MFLHNDIYVYNLVILEYKIKCIQRSRNTNVFNLTNISCLNVLFIVLISPLLSFCFNFFFGPHLVALRVYRCSELGNRSWQGGGKYGILGLNPGSSCLQGKHPSHCDITLAFIVLISKVKRINEILSLFVRTYCLLLLIQSTDKIQVIIEYLCVIKVNMTTYRIEPYRNRPFH